MAKTRGRKPIFHPRIQLSHITEKPAWAISVALELPSKELIDYGRQLNLRCRKLGLDGTPNPVSVQHPVPPGTKLRRFDDGLRWRSSTTIFDKTFSTGALLVPRKGDAEKSVMIKLYDFLLAIDNDVERRRVDLFMDNDRIDLNTLYPHLLFYCLDHIPAKRVENLQRISKLFSFFRPTTESEAQAYGARFGKALAYRLQVVSDEQGLEFWRYFVRTLRRKATMKGYPPLSKKPSRLMHSVSREEEDLIDLTAIMLSRVVRQEKADMTKTVARLLGRYAANELLSMQLVEMVRVFIEQLMVDCLLELSEWKCRINWYKLQHFMEDEIPYEEVA